MIFRQPQSRNCRIGLPQFLFTSFIAAKVPVCSTKMLRLRLGTPLSTSSFGVMATTTDADSIWNHRRNIEIRMLRWSPEKMQPGDVLHIPIPWRSDQHPDVHPRFRRRYPYQPKRWSWSAVEIRADRESGNGLFGPPDRFCTDPCTADDPG